MTPDERADRLEALVWIQSAEIASLLLCAEELATFARRSDPTIPLMSELYVEYRRKFVQSTLERLEDESPAVAARIQALISRSATNYPLDYQ